MTNKAFDQEKVATIIIDMHTLIGLTASRAQKAGVDKKKINEIFDISSSINGSTEKYEILSNLEIRLEMALSVLPQVMNDKFAKFKKSLNKENVDEIIKLIHQSQADLNKYKKNIQAYALKIFKISKKNTEIFDKEISSRSQNWDSSRITLMDKLILRLVMAEIMYIDHVPPRFL